MSRYYEKRLFEQMRIINRVVLETRTKNITTTRITERIIETNQVHVGLSDVIIPGLVEHNPLGPKVMCNICTLKFDFTDDSQCLCPSCGSRDVSLV